MLSCDEQRQLADAIGMTAEIMGTTLGSSALMIMVKDLSDYPMPVLADALKACRREITGRLTLAGILQRVQAADGRPGRDEAWSIALSSHDESDTVVMTQEILQALSASRPVMEAGDKVGARMAFLSAYDRLVDEARRNAVPARWTVSLGHDPQRRVAALETAVRMQRLPADYAARQIARLTHEPASDDGRAIAGLISGTVTRPSPENQARFATLRADVAAYSSAQAANKTQEAIAARQLHQQRLQHYRQQLEQMQEQRAKAGGAA